MRKQKSRPVQIEMFNHAAAPSGAVPSKSKGGLKRKLVYRSPYRPLSLSAFEEKHDARFYTLSNGRVPGKASRRVDHGSQK